jgi:hypothetical protein
MAGYLVGTIVGVLRRQHPAYSAVTRDIEPCDFVSEGNVNINQTRELTLIMWYCYVSMTFIDKRPGLG